MSGKKLVRQGGALAGCGRGVRGVTALVLAVACAALAFTQLGFLGVGMPGEYDAYAVVLLLPVSLAALLLGTLAGSGMGVLAGALLLAHATAMPLDFYELSFVTPLTSVIMLGVAGLMLGALFGFALRNDPPRVRRIIYIVIVCVVVSWLYSIGFMFNVVVQMVIDVAENLPADATDEGITALARARAATVALRMGDVGLQAWVDALLMAVFCIGADFLAAKAESIAAGIGLRGMFATRLSVVVLIAFLVTSGASFAAITQGDIDEAARDMSDELAYLCNQIDHSKERSELVDRMLEDAGADLLNAEPESFSQYVKAVSMDSLLDGYSAEDDGSILVMVAALTDEQFEAGADESDAEDYIIALSDDERFGADGEAAVPMLGDIAGPDLVDAVKASVASGGLARVVYDQDYAASLDELAADEDQPIRSEIVYLLARDSGDFTVAIMYPASKVFAGRAGVIAWTALSAFVLLATVFAATFLLLSRAVVRRIDETNEVLGRITGGDLDARVEVCDTREFASLSDGVNETVGALKGWIAEAESRIDAELATAREIQEAALPRVFPPYPDIDKFDVYATMEAAREVGGDFYDFFLIGDAGPESGKLGFVIADVSGKGVPAALFMMKAKTQLRDYLESGMEVGEAVENANRQLCDGNEAGMFVTAWVGVLDYVTSRIEFVNAGHNPPLLWQANPAPVPAPAPGSSAPTSDPAPVAPVGTRSSASAQPEATPTSWRWLTEKSGLPLGLFDEFPYEAYSLDCGIGDELLLYTDGVTEALDAEGELYGEGRLEALMGESFTLHPRMLVEAVRRDVAEWAAGADQSDDITVLALEVGVPPEVTATLVVPADTCELTRVNEFIHTELDRRLCPLRVQNQLDIAVEELFVNVAHYAYPDAAADSPGEVRISYAYSAEPPSIEVQIADEGIPYDPLAKPDAVTPDDIMDVPIGGLGILMAKRSVDEMTYERVDDSNIVTIVKKW